LDAEIAAFLDQAAVAEGIGARLNRLLFGFLEAEVLPQAMRAAELGVHPTPLLEVVATCPASGWRRLRRQSPPARGCHPRWCGMRPLGSDRR
jgi:hypothetical protein